MHEKNLVIQKQVVILIQSHAVRSQVFSRDKLSNSLVL